jgi:LPS-assembly lipoprotein
MKRRTALKFLRQASLASVAAMAVGGCGFKLRSSQNYAFATIAIMPNPGGALALELRRSFGSAVHVLSPEEPLDKAQLVFDVLSEQREKIVVAVNSSGQVREFQLRIRVKFRVRTPQGEERVPESEILQQRDISFNESAVLAKEAEEALLYRDMQSDIVQQLLRRLAAIK